jgi:Big-like domain-containing protein/VCBS repeat protein
MTFVHSLKTQKNILRNLSPLSLIPMLLIMSILFLSTAALAANGTATTLDVSPASASAGPVITLTATVSSGGVPLAAGQVKFCNASATYCDNGALLGTVWVTSSGTATLRRALPVGTTNVKAVFQVNNSYATSSSGTSAVTVTGVGPDPTPLEFLSGGSNAGAIYAGDFNNDGYVDLAVYDHVLGALQIFLGSSSNTFTAGGSLPVNDGNHWMVADINRDGNLDLVNAYSGQVYLGAGNGTFSAGTTMPSTACAGSDARFTAAIADVNGDGKPDIVESCDLSNNIYTLIGSGTGTFTAGPSTSTGSPGPCGSGVPGIGGFALADFNGDGKPDLFVAGYNGSDANACTFLGTGSGTFTNAGAPTFTDAPAFGPIAVGDFRNVGYPDVITGASGQYGFLLNNGTAIASFGPAVVYGANPSLIADFNGDGNLDYADIGEAAAYGLAGNGNATFAAARSVAASPVPASELGTTGDFYNVGIPAVAITTGLSPSYVEIMPMLTLPTTAVAVTCAPSVGRFGSSATTCTGQTTAGATGLMSITYNGTAWGSGDVNASGAFSVSGLGGMPAGSYSIAATYAGDSNFSSAFGSVNYTIDQLTPTIAWATPAAITYGTPLSTTQLNATASVPGTFAYTPAAGTVLTAGMQTLSVTFTPTDTVDYSPAESMVTLTVNPAPVVAYTLTSSTQSVSGSTSVTLGLTSTNYVGTVSFATSVTSTDGAASTVSASAPSVTLTSGGAGTSVLTITANANAANHVPVAPWTSGGAVMFGAVLLGVPFTARRRRTLAVLLTAAAIMLAGFSMACSGAAPSTKPARTYTVTVTPTGTGTVTNPAPVNIVVTVQ